MTPNRIFLVGPMGAGKTTVGRRLAQLTGYRFIDSDHEIERRAGVDIPYIFEKEGEAGFRLREKRVIDELTLEDGIVLATGGGAILDPENRQALKSRGCVAYLHASVDEQLRRTRYGTHRPLLQTADPAARLTALMEQREPLYRETADIVVETGRRFPKAVASQICLALQQHESALASHPPLFLSDH